MVVKNKNNKKQNKGEEMKRIHVDMDGTLARFHDEVKYLERMYEPLFFLTLRPFHSVVDAMRILASNDDFELFVLSSCITESSKEEKKKWLKAFLPEIPESNYIFVDIGENKAKCLGHPISEDDILLDDYNLNLEEWREAGGLAIKLVNNINDQGLYGPRWNGSRVYYDDAAETTAAKIAAIVA